MRTLITEQVKIGNSFQTVTKEIDPKEKEQIRVYESSAEAMARIGFNIDSYAASTFGVGKKGRKMAGAKAVQNCKNGVSSKERIRRRCRKEQNRLNREAKK